MVGLEEELRLAQDLTTWWCARQPQTRASETWVLLPISGKLLSFQASVYSSQNRNHKTVHIWWCKDLINKMNKSPWNGNWYTQHSEQMFLIIVLLFLLFFIFRDSHSSARGNKCTFLEQHTALRPTPSCSEPMQYGRQPPPRQPTTICFLTSDIAHTTFGCNSALYRSVLQPDRALLGYSRWLIPSHIANSWPRRWSTNTYWASKQMDALYRA